MSVLILDSDYEELLNLRRKNHKNKKLQEKCKRLTNNWNELEEWLKEDNPNVYCCSKSSQKAFEGAKAIYKTIILNKMKEIKEGKDND